MPTEEDASRRRSGHGLPTFASVRAESTPVVNVSPRHPQERMDTVGKGNNSQKNDKKAMKPKQEAKKPAAKK
jgi:hypothetical protein